MRKDNRRGASLIEILVVIVVFLVGILAMIQVFPTGLGILRTTRSNTVAAALGRAEVQRILGNRAQLANFIAPVIYSGSVITINPRQGYNDLSPIQDAGGGRINNAGQVILSGNPVGEWPKVSQANLISRVIEEGRPITAPRNTPYGYVSMMQLQFAPIYYVPDPGTGIGDELTLMVYGNDFHRRWGSKDGGNSTPDPFNASNRTQYFYVEADDATDSTETPYLNRDQVWIGAPRDPGNALYRVKYRFSFSFAYNNGGVVDNYDVIVRLDIDPAAPPALATNVGNYWVVDVRELVGLSSPYSTSIYTPANVVNIDEHSMRIQRVFDEIPASAAPAFNPDNPYEYCVPSVNLGSLMVNPAASRTRVTTTGGAVEPLEVRADYTVFDWRIIRDEFRIPSGNATTVKLQLNSIKVLGRPGPDARSNAGLGIDAPDNAGATGQRDFVLHDIETGGIILGGPDSGNSSYVVDYTNGAITFRDVDAGTPGMQVRVGYKDITGNWTFIQTVNAAGRNVRALYMANGEWSVQMHKAANSYRITGVGAGGLSVGEVYVGGTQGDGGGGFLGDPTRLYFPLVDLGHRAFVREAWYRDSGGVVRVLREQEVLINSVASIGGIDYATATPLPAGATFNVSANGYAVRGVRGSSLRVRVLWNPDTFFLTADELENYDRLQTWMQATRRIQTESFLTTGDSK